jgi:uncharacterized protein YegL
MDVVLVIDGSGSLGEEGWKESMNAAWMIIDSFEAGGTGNASIAVIVYSGPPTWSGVAKCWNTGVDCRMNITHFTNDYQKLKNMVEHLPWPQGSTLTSLALQKANAELALGTKDHKAVVIVITDGRPLSYRATGLAARALRKSARLVWVPVTEYAPLKEIKKWATRRWQENVVTVDSFRELSNPETVTHLIADVCSGDKGWPVLD